MATPRAAPLSAPDSLRDQGVLGLQLRQQGTNAELRLRWGQGSGVVEATLKETGLGVEIQLAAGPDQQGLLHRVAETLAARRGEHGFELDGVDVDADVDADVTAHLGAGLSQHRDRDQDQDRDRNLSRPQAPGGANHDGDPVHQRHRSAGVLNATGPLPGGTGSNYCR